MAGRVVRDEEDAEKLIAQWMASREPMSVWCKRNGVSRHSLQWWRSPGVGGGSATGVVRVAEVVLPRPGPEYRIVLGNGREVVVADFEPEALRRLLAVVEA
jgi:hypothetical protein